MSNDKKREETKAKLRAFLQAGDSEDVASVLVHTLMQHADDKAVKQSAPKTPKPKKKK
jgi:predicted exporter